MLIALMLTAHADPAPVAAVVPVVVPPVAGWSMGEVLALIALIVAGVGAVVDAIRGVLHFVAPRTKTTLDDRAAASLDALHDRLVSIESRLPPVLAAKVTP